ITPLRDDDGTVIGYAKITRDATARKRREDRMRALLQVAQAMLRGGDEDAVLELIVSRARELVDADLAAIMIAVPEEDALVVRVVDGRNTTVSRGQRVPLEGSLVGSVVATGRPLVFHDSSMVSPRHRPLLTASGVEEVVVVPLASAERR